MSTLLDRAKAMFAAAVAMLAGGQVAPSKPLWGGFGFVRPAQRSRHRVAMDKRAAVKARNVKRNKAHG